MRPPGLFFLLIPLSPCALAPWQAAAAQQFEEAAAYVILSHTRSALVVVHHRQHWRPLTPRASWRHHDPLWEEHVRPRERSSHPCPCRIWSPPPPSCLSFSFSRRMHVHVNLRASCVNLRRARAASIRRNNPASGTSAPPCGSLRLLSPASEQVSTSWSLATTNRTHLPSNRLLREKPYPPGHRCCFVVLGTPPREADLHVPSPLMYPVPACFCI
jgi:hypothetical protein